MIFISVITLVSLYALLLLVPAIAFLRFRPAGKHPKQFPFISVIVPVRNEEKGIHRCIRSLLSQDYPKEQFEIIVVNDHSTDGTASILAELQRKHEGMVIHHCSENESGKKAAVSRAVSAAHGSIIAATDGDCAAQSGWLQAIALTFENEEIVFATGPLTYFRNGSFIRGFLQTELESIQVLSGGSAALGFPLLANGANMAYRKSFFDEAGGYSLDRHVSGDDMTLLQLARRSGKGIAYISGKAGLVETACAETLGEAIEQRARWLSKTGTYRSAALLLYSLVLLLANLLPLLTGLACLFRPDQLPAFLTATAGKMLVDLLLLSLAVPFFREPVAVLLSPLGTLLYPWLVIASVVKSFTGSIRWKSRVWEK